MTSPFDDENDRSRRKLKQIAEALTPEEMALETPYGWKVSALFAHMTWWDQRVLVLLRRWKEHGVGDSPVDSEAINEALKPVCHAVAPEAAVRLCLASAEETDAEVAAMSPALQAEIEASSNHFRFNRSFHRNGHIDDILTLVPRLKDVTGG